MTRRFLPGQKNCFDVFACFSVFILTRRAAPGTLLRVERISILVWTAEREARLRGMDVTSVGATLGQVVYRVYTLSRFCCSAVLYLGIFARFLYKS